MGQLPAFMLVSWDMHGGSWLSQEGGPGIASTYVPGPEVTELSICRCERVTADDLGGG